MDEVVAFALHWVKGSKRGVKKRKFLQRVRMSSIFRRRELSFALCCHRGWGRLAEDPSEAVSIRLSFDYNIYLRLCPAWEENEPMDFRISKRTALLLLLDIAATYVAYWLASVLTDVRGFVFVDNEIYFMLGVLALINVAVLAAFRLYNNLWEYASIDEALQIVLAIFFRR